jgi:hypothetical protein
MRGAARTLSLARSTRRPFPWGNKLRHRRKCFRRAQLSSSIGWSRVSEPWSETAQRWGISPTTSHAQQFDAIPCLGGGAENGGGDPRGRGTASAARCGVLVVWVVSSSRSRRWRRGRRSRRGPHRRRIGRRSLVAPTLAERMAKSKKSVAPWPLSSPGEGRSVGEIGVCWVSSDHVCPVAAGREQGGSQRRGRGWIASGRSRISAVRSSVPVRRGWGENNPGIACQRARGEWSTQSLPSGIIRSSTAGPSTPTPRRHHHHDPRPDRRRQVRPRPDHPPEVGV